MIRNLVLVLIMMTVAIGCEDQDDKKEEVDLSQKNKQLTEELNKTQQRNDGLKNVISDIKNNLQNITEKEAELQRIEPGPNAGSEVQNLTNEINDLMMDSREKIESLNKQIRNSSYRASKFSRRIDTLEKHLNKKEMMVDSLTMQTQDMRQKIENMEEQASEMERDINELKTDANTRMEELQNKTTRLNTAYYIMGEEDELIEKDVLKKTGGFLGFLGQCKVMKCDFNKDAFSKIDIRNKQSFDIPYDDIRLVTPHPTKAYRLEKEDGDVQKLMITNAESFWEASKYLIILED